jgi:two-component system sensor histidine kinase VicK
MPAAPTTPAPHPLEVENQALRDELQRLRTAQATLAAQQAKADKYEQSQVRFRTVFDRSPLGQKIIDADLIIRQANPAVIAMLGLSHAEELVGRPILDFTHPDHRADWQRLQESLWAHETPFFTLETCLVRQDGASFWCRVTSVLFQDEEGELGYTTLEDISARKELEISHQRLFAAQETMLHLVAHDLQSPVNNITMLVNLLRDDAALRTLPAEDAGQELHAFLNLIDEACATVHILLQDVLFLGQLEASRLEKHHTDLGSFLNERLKVFRVAAQAKGIALVLDIPRQPVPAAIHADKFGRILDNLLSNALKFTPAGGQIHVRLQQQEGRVRLLVQDTGLGIPAALQPHVFDKFSAAARQGLYGDTTTGLGLFITKQIVELHHGKIWLESKEHEGTTFFIDLA